jgi:8-oxo-dGTP pyrophosphatase MutT (NUDIX family)
MSSSLRISEFSEFVAGLRSRVGAGVLAPAPGPVEAAGFEPREDRDGETRRQAAVALVLRCGAEGPEVLVIKRSEAERDHWSGHLALPGGRAEAEDENLRATAVRETLEEVGLDLRAGGEVLGRLGAVNPRSPLVPRISVTPFLAIAPREYHAGGAPKRLVLSDEVAAAFWIPVDELKRGGRSAVFRMAFAGVEREWPGYPSEHGVIWGITERILTEFLSLVD